MCPTATERPAAGGPIFLSSSTSDVLLTLLEPTYEWRAPLVIDGRNRTDSTSVGGWISLTALVPNDHFLQAPVDARRGEAQDLGFDRVTFANVFTSV